MSSFAAWSEPAFAHDHGQASLAAVVEWSVLQGAGTSKPLAGDKDEEQAECGIDEDGHGKNHDGALGQ